MTMGKLIRIDFLFLKTTTWTFISRQKADASTVLITKLGVQRGEWIM